MRWKPQYRMSLEAIREITVSTPDGSQIPLGQIADIQLVEGPAIIYREDAVRYSPVKFSVRGRDLAGTIADAQRRIDAEIPRCDKAPPDGTSSVARTTCASSGPARSTSCTRPRAA